MGIKRDFSNSACYQLTTEHGSPYPYFSDSKKKKSYNLCFHLLCPNSHFRVYTTSSCHFELARLCLVLTTHPSFLPSPSTFYTCYFFKHGTSSSIQYPLKTWLFPTWWTVEPPEPWASEERVTGSGGTRSVFELQRVSFRINDWDST